jgi:hypothetical protein
VVGEVDTDLMPSMERLAVEAPRRERDRYRATLKRLADSVEYALDVSDDYVLGSGDRDELIGCTRPRNVWVEIRDSLAAAREVLAK